ncbi:uncharacterized protein N7506_010818 [Penicillium brevicompactum]|uniref:uncharacterized protein n=1 Tax=Penicillium brevicompactum TaxID=5074 RepID=UPI0025403767|nr:uncharacterized protein N7506_010818 [Penicillium brevicompactum]KAJ5321688.1 hypothetical protein N7506_010818 [Penicillium brevicompactum]
MSETMTGHSTRERPAYPHYAMIYIDAEGNLCQRSSASVAQNMQDIISPTVAGEFLRAVARSREAHGAQFHAPVALQPTQEPQSNEHSSTISQRGLMAHSGRAVSGEQIGRIPTEQNPHLQPAMWPQSSNSWSPQQEQATGSQPRKKHFGGRSLNLSSHQSASLSVDEPEILRLYYEKVFQNLQQTNCRVIAKAYIKLVEPRKQVNYPYNGRKTVDGRVQQLDPEATKPPWWPIGVCHREPDHLPKVERIRLLVHILCDLRESNGVTAARLKECDQPIRRQILPADRLQILDEMYRVREEEEKFLDGVPGTKSGLITAVLGRLTHMPPSIDCEPSVLISRANLPPIVEDTSSGQSSPTDPEYAHGAKSDCSDDTRRIDTSQVIVSAENLQKRNPCYPPNPYTPTIHPAMHNSPGIQYQSTESSPHASSSPQELKRKREMFSGTHLVDRTRQIGMAQYPFAGSSSVQPSMEMFHQQALPEEVAQAVAITEPAQPAVEVLPNDLMMPYGYPYYYSC